MRSLANTLLLAAVLGIAGALPSTEARPQQVNLGNLPPSTVVGRLGSSVSGPGQAIPLATLQTALNAIGGGSNGGILSITRAQIPSTNIGANTTVMISGYNSVGDYGYGAIYSSVNADCTRGLEYIRDSGLVCFNLVIPPGGKADVGWFGARADGGNNTIAAGDITANPQWKGTYTAGTTWDTVGIQEAIYAAFAGSSTPGHIDWNSVTFDSGNFTLFIPAGIYGVNVTLLSSMTNGIVEFQGKQGTQIRWVGTQSNSPIIWLCDHCSYSRFVNLSLENRNSQTSVSSTGPMFSLDSTSNAVFSGALLSQQNTFYDMFFSIPLNGVGFEINQTSSSQGDTNVFINPFFGCGGDGAGLIVNSANALNEVMIGGDFQGCVHRGIEVSSGQIAIYGAHAENQVSVTAQFDGAPIQTQFTMYGSDVDVVGAVNGSAQNVMSGFRSEGDILTAGGSGGAIQNAGINVSASSVIGTDVLSWATNMLGRQGMVVGDNANSENTKNRLFMIVDGGGGPWGAITGGTGTTTIQHASDGSSTNAWVGFDVFIRFGSNGFYNECSISASTATSITYTGCSNLATQTLYQIVGAASGTEPNWDSASNGKQALFTGSGQGFSFLAGSTCIGTASSISPLNVNDYVVIPNADQLAPAGQPAFVMPLYAKVTATSGSPCAGGGGYGTSSVTVNKAPTLTDTSGTRPGYFGTPITDGNLSWINVPVIAIWASYISNTSMNHGLAVATGGIDQLFLSNGKVDWQDKVFSLAAGGNPNNDTISFDYSARSGSDCGDFGAPSSPVDLSSVAFNCNRITYTPTSNVTFNAPVPSNFGEQRMTLSFVSTGTQYVMTFSTNMVSNGPVILSSSSGAKTVIEFRSQQHAGTNTWVEVWRSTEGAGTNSTVASPAGPNSTSVFKMQGLAGTITPTRTGNINLQICGTITETGITAAGSGIEYQLSYGTSTAPGTNAALTGTQVGTIQEYMLAQTVTAADVFVPFCQSAVITGLTTGTPYWLDLAAEAVANTGFAFSKVNIAAQEF